MTPTTDEERAKNAERMRRYRAGYRSPWGRGRPPSPQRLVIIAAGRLLANILDHRDGWSVFDSELNDEGQEAANDLAIALARLRAARARARKRLLIEAAS